MRRPRPQPDWSRWSDEVGLIRKPGEAFFEGSRRDSYNPATAETYASIRTTRIEPRQALLAAVAAAEMEPHPGNDTKNAAFGVG